MFSSLPEGYNSDLSGQPFSLAKQSLLSLARAFVGNPCVVLIDNLSFNFEDAVLQKVLAALSEHMADKVIIVSAPPLIFAGLSPKILTIEDKKISASLPDVLPQAVKKLSSKIASIKGREEPAKQNAIFRRIAAE